MVMERFPPGGLQEDEGESPPPSPHPRGLFSCWARLKRAFPAWRRLRRRGSERWRLLRSRSMAPRRRRPKPGSFRYDPLSYAQNFEDKDVWDGDDDPSSHRGFSSRFVVITPAPPAAVPDHPAPEEK
ncbi:hypothetical protein Taro_006207 [Colocasia esculenta]|uniref:Uncharacterized protein n=1 Tax=Colocasia esculenta TaxID=4460 RepID=A0A843TWH2_COLES|nr:hypothetical protein [Colocasia esculenta]